MFRRKDPDTALEVFADRIDDTDRRIAAVEHAMTVLTARKDTGLRDTIVAGIFTLSVAGIGAGALIYTDDAATTPALVVQCGVEKQQAKNLYYTDGIWTDYDQDSEVEKQCHINTYIVELRKPPLQDPAPS